MLRALTEFPHAGSKAFLAPDGAPVRILRHNGDGTALVQALPRHPGDSIARAASGNRQVDATDLFETREQACTPRFEQEVVACLADCGGVALADIAGRVAPALGRTGSSLTRAIAELLRRKGWRPTRKFDRRIGRALTIWRPALEVASQ